MPRANRAKGRGRTVSTMEKIATTTTVMPIATMSRKMACQPNNSMVRPPSVGAKAGPTARMMPIRFMIRAERSWVKRSRTSAREIATPTAAPTPCRKRAAISISIVGASSAKTRGGQIDGHKGDGDGLAAETVRQRAADQLGEGEAGKIKRQRHLHSGFGRAEGVHDFGHRRREQRHRDGADARPAARRSARRAVRSSRAPAGVTDCMFMRRSFPRGRFRDFAVERLARTAFSVSSRRVPVLGGSMPRTHRRAARR